jgi:hypothetical protein
MPREENKRKERKEEKGGGRTKNEGRQRGVGSASPPKTEQEEE